VGPNRTSVGLDVHARSVVAWLDGQTGELFERRLTPDHREILGWVKSLPGPAVVTYEAGPTGFGLARFLTMHGIACQVAAPSKLQRPCGIGSRPTCGMPGVWLGCCTWGRSSR
jgi:transposase